MTRQPVLIATICLVLAGIGDVGAESLTKNQQKCAGRLNKDLAKVDAAVAKQITGCLKNHARGKPLSKTDPSVVTLEDCIVADEKEKISKATQKTFDDFDKACVGTDRGGVSNYPPFAATNASMVNDAGTTKALNLSHDIFGADLDSGVLLTAEMSRHAAMCQQKVWKAAAKCQSTRLKEFASCAKAAFKSGSVGSGEELENQCQGSVSVPQSDDKGKIAKACLGAEGGIGKTVSKCDENLDLDSLLPGCAGEAHADCVAEKVATRVCQLINQAGGLARDCGDATEIQYVAGLRAGGLSSASGMSFLLNPGNLDTVSSNSGAVGGIDPFGPSAAWSESQEPSGPWQDNWTIIYSGEIYDADGQMAFREDFDDNVNLTVCGQTVLDDTNWWNETSGSVDCGGGGWHSFELRLHNVGGGAGVANGIGFEWDPAGGTAWQKPQNTDSNTADVFRTEEGVPYSGDCASASCISGLVCSANICHLAQALGGDCTHAHTLCPVGSACTAGTCQMEVAAGDSCSAASTVCASGLSCYQGFCQTELSLSDDCSSANTYCQTPNICRDGTCQAPAGEVTYGPGLLAGGLASDVMSMAPNPGNLDSVSVGSGAVDGVDPLGPSAASVVWTTDLATSGVWDQHWTNIYSGQIRDPDQDGLMAFREYFDEEVWLEVCGQIVLDDDEFWAESTNTVDCGAGEWFDFELRLHNGWAGAGPTNGIGVQWDPAGGVGWQTPQNTDENTADVFRFAEGPRVGEACTVGACALPGTICWDGVCQLELPLGGGCSLAHTVCPGGQGCTLQGTCTTGLLAGGDCYASGVACERELMCQAGTCQSELTNGEDCSEAHTYCGIGFTCDGGTCREAEGNELIHVYPPVPGLAASGQYAFRLRSQEAEEWLDAFAFVTTGKSSLCASGCDDAAPPLAACSKSYDCATNMYCHHPEGVCKYDCADAPDPAEHCGDDAGDAHYYQHLAGWTNTYINFEMPYGHAVEIEISRVDGTPITTGVVHPARKGTAEVIDGNVVVTMDNPAQITVDIDGQMDSQHTGRGYDGPPIHTLTLFGNPTLEDRPDPLYASVLSVAPGTDVSNIDVNGSWEILYFEPGVHDIGAGFPVNQGKSYYIPGDAIVYGTLRNEDWSNGNNIRIFGYGTLSGARLAHPNYVTLASNSMHNPIDIMGATNTSVEGITIEDSAFHALMLYGGYQPTQPTDVRWVKIFTWRGNGDGINPFGNVRIEDSFMRTQDDSSYVGGRGFSRVTMWNDANGTAFLMTAVGCTSEVGCHASGLDAPTVVIEDSDVLYSRGAWDFWNGGRIFSIRAEGGGPGGPGLIFQNIKVHDPLPTLQPFYILTQAGDPYTGKIFSSDSEEKYCLEGGGTWDDVEETCADVTEWNCLAANGAWQGPSTCLFYEQRDPGDITGIVFKNIEIAANSVLGHPNMLHGRADAMISEIVFDNVTIGGELIDSPEDFCVNEFVGALTFCDADNANCTTLEPSGDGLACPCDAESGYSWDDRCDDPVDAECPTCDLMVTEAPEDLHFLTRDLGNDKCQVTVSGQLTGGATEARIRLTRDGVAYSASSSTSTVFSITQTIDAELALYDVFIEWTYSNDFFRTVDQIEDIVCGDAILLDGQSNAQAPDHHDENTADTGVNTFVRSWGASVTGAAVTSMHGFNIAVAEAGAWLGSIGQWGLQLANNLKDEHGIPILVFNGAVGGTQVVEHLRDDANPENPETIYGSLLWRVRQAGVEDAVRAIFWHQGEDDTTMAYNTYLGLWTTMYTAWLEDYPNVEGVFPFQIRAGCGNPTWSRNVQRELPTLLPKVPASMSTTGVSGHDGCHFYSIAYTEWGDRMSRIVSRELYGVTPPGNIDAPNPQSATWTSPTTLEIDYGATGGAMTLQTGAESYFSLSDGATITNVAVVDAKIVITTESASTATWVSMVDVAGDIPWLVNDLGVGGFAYYEFPVTP